MAYWIAEPGLATLIPFVGALCIALSGRSKLLRVLWTFAAALGLWFVVLHLLFLKLNGIQFVYTALPLGPNLSLAFQNDGFGLVFALVSSTLWLLTSSYSIGYAQSTDMHNRTRFFAVFALCIGSAIGIALAANLLTLFICYEILTIATYPLVVHAGTIEARKAGRVYLCYALPAGACLLAATAWSYFTAGHLNFIPGGFLPANLPVQHVQIIFLLFALGFGVKAGMMPIHAWLPIAMIAPTPVSALLHAVAVVKAGVFGYLRLIYFIFGPELMREAHLWQPLAWTAAATILISSLIALQQDELKRRLAYSTIGHLSYIILGAALLVPSGQIGSLMHLASHAMMKITLFFCAGSIYVVTHRTRVSQLRGLGWQMPWTFAAFAVGALGLAGTPLISGFVSKWWLVRATLDTQQFWLMGVLLVSGILNLAYLLPIVTSGFALSARTPNQEIKEAPLSMPIPLLATAALSLLFGMFIPLISGELSLLYSAVISGWAK